MTKPVILIIGGIEDAALTARIVEAISRATAADRNEVPAPDVDLGALFANLGNKAEVAIPDAPQNPPITVEASYETGFGGIWPIDMEQSRKTNDIDPNDRSAIKAWIIGPRDGGADGHRHLIILGEARKPAFEGATHQLDVFGICPHHDVDISIRGLDGVHTTSDPIYIGQIAADSDEAAEVVFIEKIMDGLNPMLGKFDFSDDEHWIDRFGDHCRRPELRRSRQ